MDYNISASLAFTTGGIIYKRFVHRNTEHSGPARNLQAWEKIKNALFRDANTAELNFTLSGTSTPAPLAIIARTASA